MSWHGKNHTKNKEYRENLAFTGLVTKNPIQFCNHLNIDNIRKRA